MIIVFISSLFALQTLSFAPCALQRRHSDSAVFGITVITPLETAPKLQIRVSITAVNRHDIICAKRIMVLRSTAGATR